MDGPTDQRTDGRTDGRTDAGATTIYAHIFLWAYKNDPIIMKIDMNHHIEDIDLHPKNGENP